MPRPCQVIVCETHYDLISEIGCYMLPNYILIMPVPDGCMQCFLHSRFPSQRVVHRFLILLLPDPGWPASEYSRQCRLFWSWQSLMHRAGMTLKFLDKLAFVSSSTSNFVNNRTLRRRAGTSHYSASVKICFRITPRCVAGTNSCSVAQS